MHATTNSKIASYLPVEFHELTISYTFPGIIIDWLSVQPSPHPTRLHVPLMMPQFVEFMYNLGT